MNVLTKRQSSSGIISFLPILILIALAFWTYRSGIVSVPRSDHYGFMAEREYVKSDFNFLMNQLSYNRTRMVAKGDSYLFRPGTTGILALIDIFFRHNLYVTGIFSIVFHALAATSLYWLLCRFVDPLLAFGASVMFVTQLGGFEMVFWRHISAYMLCLFFFGLALCALDDWLKLKKSIWTASIFLFLSCIFHEVTLIVMVASVALFASLGWLQKKHDVTVASRFQEVALACLVPLVVSIALNSAAFIYYRSLFDLLAPKVQGLNIFEMGNIFVFVAGLILTVFLIPSLIHFSFSDLAFRADWLFLKLPSWIFLVGGVFFLILILLTVCYLIVQRKQTQLNPHWLIGCLTMVFLISTYVGLVAGRAIPRSIGYLQNSTYYFYMTNYSLTVLAVLWIGQLLQSVGSIRLRQGIMVLLVFFLGYQVFSGVSGIQRTLKPRYDNDLKTAQMTLQTWSQFGSYSNYCYGGTADTDISTYVPNILLYRISCNAFPKKTPLYIMNNGSEGVWLMKLNSHVASSGPYRYGYLASNRDLVFSPEANHEPLNLNGFAVSSESFQPILLEMQIRGGSVGGFLYNYADAGNFSILVANDRYAYAQQNQNGVPSDPTNVASQIISPISFELSIKRINNRYAVFYNQTLLSVIAGEDIWNGKIGLYRKPDSAQKQGYFLNFKLLNAPDAGLDNAGEFEPVSPFLSKTA